jgi:hypothetical protein
LNSANAAHAGIDAILADRTASDWLKTAVWTAVHRDPVDALNDALLLAGLLEERLRNMFELSAKD